MEVAKALAAKDSLPCDAWFTYVVREETDGAGTQSFAEWFKEKRYVDQYKNVVVVFGEPTGLDTAQYGHRGNFFIKAEANGDAGSRFQS